MAGDGRKGKGRKRSTRRSLEQRVTGGQGGRDDVPRWERVLERKAVSSGWVISQKRRASMVTTLFDTIESDVAPFRDKVAATRVVASIDSINVQLEKQQTPPDQHHIHEHAGQIDVRAAVVHMQQDPAYVDYLNKLALDGDGVPAEDGSQSE